MIYMRRDNVGQLSHALILLISIPILFLTAISGWNVDVFQLLNEDEVIIFQSPVALGNKFTTRYIHSVELTPVEDEYRILGGRLWAWEERVRSTNAGLPFNKPEHGRFIDNGVWMIFQGGRMSWNEYYYRIGNNMFGLNQAVLEPFGRRNLYKIFTGERLIVRVSKSPLILTGFYRTKKLAEAPMGVSAIENFTR